MTRPEVLPEIVDRLVQRFRPLRIILFGSVARGEERPDSDIDLVVVRSEGDEGGKREMAAATSNSILSPAPTTRWPCNY